MGLFKLGFVTIYLSDPLTRALTCAAAVHVFTSQVRQVFGINMGRFNGPLRLIYVSLSIIVHLLYLLTYLLTYLPTRRPACT